VAGRRTQRQREKQNENKQMARLTVGQKANRVLQLLMGLRNPVVAAALQEHGFTDQDLEEGWKRLSGLTRQRLGVRVTVENPAKLQELDAFENKWFPLVHFTLHRHFPEVEAELFLNLSQTEGVEVVLSVSTFVERISLMAEGKAPFGTDGPAAMTLMETRGLTAERIARARALLSELGTFSAPVPVEPPAIEEQAAEDALWAWYLEWGGIARHVVSDRRALRAMGFLSRRPAGDGEDEGSEGEDGDPVEASDLALVSPTAVASPALG